MSLVGLVMGRGWIFILTFLVIIIILINYEPLINYYPQLQFISDAISPTIPIIGSLIIGIFMQRVALLYKLFENAITRHLEELNNVAKDFLNIVSDISEDLSKSAYFSGRIPGIYNGHRLYIYIEAPLCHKYNDALAKYDGVLDDIGYHWKNAEDVFKRLKILCADINKHNNKVKKIESELNKELQNLIKAKALNQLPGVNVEYLHNFIYSIIITNLIYKIIKDKKNFTNISQNYLKELYTCMVKDLKINKDRNGNLWIGGYNVGAVQIKDWKSLAQPIIVELINELLSKFGNHLDKLTKEGQNLIDKARTTAKDLFNTLNYVAKAKFLPPRLCKYLYPE